MNVDLPVTPVAAATLLLIRDGAAGLEVLMAARHEQSGFAAGALVFPGGKVDGADVTLARRHPGLDGLSEAGAAARIAAIRETWEECGILLARRGRGGAMLSAAELAGARGRGMDELLADSGMQLAVDCLAPFAHWVTPADRPKRFDTLFFMAPLDCDQEALHDGREAVDARWVRPNEIVADADAGRTKLVFATRLNLLRLEQSRSVAEAMDAAREASIVTITPQVVKTSAGTVFRIPPDAGYPIHELPVDKVARA
jgi:8-oxo-dGTP pyrophosphatase MutT (NUDIX family)